MTKRKIIFLLPGMDYNPTTNKAIAVGGYKVVYEYANRFAADGYDVTIAYSHTRCFGVSLWRRFYAFVGYHYRKLRNQLRGAEWFDLNPNVKKLFCYRFSPENLKLESGDVVFATAYETAVELNALNQIPNVHKCYFIQGYELWSDTEENVQKSFRFGMHNFVIAPWLQEKVENAGANATLITNGFNFEEFHLDIPIEARSRYEVVMLNHKLNHKRCVDAWAALAKVKKEVPQLHVTMFGVYPPPMDMPDWYTYYQCPTKEQLNAIYNKGAIYVAASDFEGFGLTIGEAMICGCAVACTDNGGFACMAKHGDTALLSPIYDVDALAQNIVSLIKDDELRIKISQSATEYIRKFDWGISYAKLRNEVEAIAN